jgi:hypothetical protein
VVCYVQLSHACMYHAAAPLCSLWYTPFCSPPPKPGHTHVCTKGFLTSTSVAATASVYAVLDRAPLKPMSSTPWFTTPTHVAASPSSTHPHEVGTHTHSSFLPPPPSPTVRTYSTSSGECSWPAYAPPRAAPPSSPPGAVPPIPPVPQSPCSHAMTPLEPGPLPGPVAAVAAMAAAGPAAVAAVG